MEQLTAEDIALSALAAINLTEIQACKRAAAGQDPWLIHPATGRTVLLSDIIWAAERDLIRDGQQ